jgi:phage anti-repressor protein
MGSAGLVARITKRIAAPSGFFMRAVQRVASYGGLNGGHLRVCRFFVPVDQPLFSLPPFVWSLWVVVKSSHKEISIMTSKPVAVLVQASLIPVFTGTIGGVSVQLVKARDLHAFLQVGRDFTTWIKGRLLKYGFIESQDFEVFTKTGENLQGGRPADDYHLTLDTAKELSMVENNEQGRAARRYFIECERRQHNLHRPQPAAKSLPSPESVHVLNSLRRNAEPLLGAWQPDLRMDYHDCLKALADVEKLLILVNGHGIQTGHLQQRITAATQMLINYHGRMADAANLLISLRFAMDLGSHPTIVTNNGAKSFY